MKTGRTSDPPENPWSGPFLPTWFRQLVESEQRGISVGSFMVSQLEAEVTLLGKLGHQRTAVCTEGPATENQPKGPPHLSPPTTGGGGGGASCPGSLGQGTGSLNGEAGWTGNVTPMDTFELDSTGKGR